MSQVHTLRFNAIRVIQPIGTFYVGAMPACVLKDMAAADVRRVRSRELEEYSGTQRALNRARVTEIEQFIRAVDAAFPNTIILNVMRDKVIEIGGEKTDVPPDSPPLERNSVVTLEISGDEKTFSIIDGQHRLAGFQNDNCTNFDLIVALFIDLVVEEQAYLFSTINLTQTKVNKSLVYDLFDVAETRSPQRVAHHIVRALNAEKESPFYKRIKLLGVTPRYEGQPLYAPMLTQGTVVSRLLDLISRDPSGDRDTEKRGEKQKLSGREIEEGLIFRQPYVENQEWAIYKVMSSYFGAVARNFVGEWNDPKNPLARTIGYGALMRLLVPLYQRGYAKRDVSAAYFETVIGNMKVEHDRRKQKLSFDEFPASGTGENRLFGYLKELAAVI